MPGRNQPGARNVSSTCFPPGRGLTVRPVPSPFPPAFPCPDLADGWVGSDLRGTRYCVKRVN